MCNNTLPIVHYFGAQITLNVFLQLCWDENNIATYLHYCCHTRISKTRNTCRFHKKFVTVHHYLHEFLRLWMQVLTRIHGCAKACSTVILWSGSSSNIRWTKSFASSDKYSNCRVLVCKEYMPNVANLELNHTYYGSFTMHGTVEWEQDREWEPEQRVTIYYAELFTLHQDLEWDQTHCLLLCQPHSLHLFHAHFRAVWTCH